MARGRLIVATWFGLWVWLCATMANADTPVYRFGAGSKTGGFTRIAKALADGLEQTGDHVQLEIQNTGGSCDNIRKLLGGELDFALVQYDVAAEAFLASQLEAPEGGATQDPDEGGGAGWMCEVSTSLAQGVDLQLVGALTDGAVHVLLRRPVRLDSFSTLGEHKIYIGKDGSGSLETGKVIIGAAGLTLGEINRFEGGSSKAFAALERGELLVMLRTTEPGHTSIAKVVGAGLATVNPLPDTVLERLIDGYPYYRVCQIEAGTYPGLNFAVPTVCVSTVLLTAHPNVDDPEHVAQMEAAVGHILDGLAYVQDAPDHEKLGLQVRWRDFAEREPIPLHPVSEQREGDEQTGFWGRVAASSLGMLVLFFGVRRLLRKRGILKDPLKANLEGQWANPLVPFAGFVLIVVVATLVVWNLEHDHNARVRTLNDSFWEMNMFATGNFDTESLKTSTARFVGAAATIAGLGLLAWFTAALTNIFARDQTRLFRRLRNHIVILNFREDMLQLIRVLRSPGPLRFRPIHVVVSDALPKRVRLQLARIKGLTIYHSNPEVPEDLATLKIPRAARVIVLQGQAGPNAVAYHPLRIARAVHQACTHAGPQGPELGRAGFSIMPPVQDPAVAGEDAGSKPSLPVTLVEATESDPDEVFRPFNRWLIPVPGRQLADSWLATACVNRRFPDIFNSVVSFAENNSEVYTAALPAWFHGRSWRVLRRVMYSAGGDGVSETGAVPLGIYRAPDAVHAYDAKAAGSSPQVELEKRLVINPALDLEIQPGDRLVAFAEDEADLRRILKASRRAADEQAEAVAAAQ